MGFRTYRNPYQPRRLRLPVYSEWKTEARGIQTMEGAKELRNEFVMSEINQGCLDDREWAIFQGRRKVNVIRFGKKGVFRVKFSE